MNTPNNPQAFPTTTQRFPERAIRYGQGGMELRDYFAAATLTGLLSNKRMTEEVEANVMAQISYNAADAMLEAREQRPEAS